MSPPHILGNFRSPPPLPPETIGPPRQLAYYSYFPDPVEYKPQSQEALRIFHRPTTPFPVTTVITKSDFDKMSSRLDSLPFKPIDPIISACKEAGCGADLSNADVITRRGVITDLSLGIESNYTVSFVGGKLRIFRKTFKSRTEITHSGPYYGHCFEELCTHSMTEKPHGVFFSIVQRQIGPGLNVVMAGEVDCSKNHDTSKEPSLDDYIELKTARRPYHFARLYPKWYLQSYLLGIPALEIGKRNKANKVTSIDKKTTEELLEYCMQPTGSAKAFNPAEPLGRAYAIFSSLLEHLRSREPTVLATDKFELRVDAEGEVSLILINERSQRNRNHRPRRNSRQRRA